MLNRPQTSEYPLSPSRLIVKLIKPILEPLAKQLQPSKPWRQDKTGKDVALRHTANLCMWRFRGSFGDFSRMALSDCHIGAGTPAGANAPSGCGCRPPDRKILDVKAIQYWTTSNLTINWAGALVIGGLWLNHQWEMSHLNHPLSLKLQQLYACSYWICMVFAALQVFKTGHSPGIVSESQQLHSPCWEVRSAATSPEFRPSFGFLLGVPHMTSTQDGCERWSLQKAAWCANRTAICHPERIHGCKICRDWLA